MKVAKVSIIAAAVLAVATLANAQGKPDFSGTWVPDPAAEAGGGGRGMGPVKQTADTLTVERMGGENKVSLTANAATAPQPYRAACSCRTRTQSHPSSPA
jgi:hypothetical protein